MSVSLGDVMRQCRNYFENAYFEGETTIKNGQIQEFFPACEYIAISGSSLNDGVHLASDPLKDEVFTGRVFELAPPADFLQLVEEISAYTEENPIGCPISETFGMYSVNYGADAVKGWRNVFSSRLAPYQRIMSKVMV